MLFVPPTDTPWTTTVDSALTAIQQFWLTKPHALTDGLRQLGKLKLVVLAEHSEILSTDEQWMLPKSATTIWCREIRMYLEDQAIVSARSLCSIEASEQAWASIRSLGNRPLADVLYADPEVQRSSFCFLSAITRQPSLNALCATELSESELQATWARSSQFLRHDQALTVTECFHPAFWQNFARLLS